MEEWRGLVRGSRTASFLKGFDEEKSADIVLLVKHAVMLSTGSCYTDIMGEALLMLVVVVEVRMFGDDRKLILVREVKLELI